MMKNRNTILCAGILLVALALPVYALACGGGGDGGSGGDGDRGGDAGSALAGGGGGVSMTTVEVMDVVALEGDGDRCQQLQSTTTDPYCDKIIAIMRRLLSASYQLTTSSISPDPNNIGLMAGIVVRLMETSKAGGS